MSLWETLQKRVNPPKEKVAEYGFATPEFVVAFTKAASCDMTEDEIASALKKLDANHKSTNGTTTARA